MSRIKALLMQQQESGFFSMPDAPRPRVRRLTKGNSASSSFNIGRLASLEPIYDPVFHAFVIQGLRDSQNEMIAIARAMATDDPHLGALNVMSARALEEVRPLTPVKTGTLQGSHIFEVNEKNSSADLFIDPLSWNYVSHSSPAIYGPQVHERSPSRAFYARTVNEEGDEILEEGAKRYFELYYEEAGVE